MGSMNPTKWANEFLGALGLPDTKTNVTNIVGWEAAEGGNWNNTAKYNPLNTTQPESGSVNYNTGQPGKGVQAYKDWTQGLDATVATIQQGDYGYPQILAALNTSQSWHNFASAVSSSSWGTKGLVNDPAPSGSNPGNNGYSAGVTATQQDGSQANSPSTAGAGKMTGFAGALQQLDALYTPSYSATIWGFIPNVPKDITNTATMIFVRATSAALSVALLIIGIKTLAGGSSSGGSSGPVSVLEFVNNAQIGNKKLGLSEERIKAQQQKEQDVAARHEQRLADKEKDRVTRERVANTPRTSYQRKESHIYHHSEKKPSKKKVQVKFVDPSDWLINKEK
jgi:hypothetical protein